MDSSYGLTIMATHFYISQVYFGQFSQLTLGHRHSKTHLQFYFYFHILSLKIPLAANSLVLALNSWPRKRVYYIIVYFKRLGSRHIHKEIEIS